MFNNYYLIQIRKNKGKPTPPQMVSLLFKEKLTEKANVWLLFEEEIIIHKNEPNVPFEHNLKNLLLISNKNMSEQIIKVLYNNDYDPFTDLINLEWFNESQKKYVIKQMNRLKEIETLKDNILIGINRGTRTFIMSEYNSTDINIKDIFFFYEIDILFTYDIKPNPKVKIYFNNETLNDIYIYRLMQKIISKYPKIYKVHPESSSIEFQTLDITIFDIFNTLNDIDFEKILGSENNENEKLNLKQTNSFKGKFKKGGETNEKE